MTDIVVKPSHLNEDEKDYLKEMMNIAYGAATAAITEIIDAFATLKIPRIEIIPAAELGNYFKKNVQAHKSHYIARQVISGEIAGESLFIIDAASARNLMRAFNESYEKQDEEECREIILEITNILSAATIGKFSEQLNSTVAFNPPTIRQIATLAQIDQSLVKGYEQLIIISTELEFEAQKIQGELILLTHDNSILWIKEQLQELLNEF